MKNEVLDAYASEQFLKPYATVAKSQLVSKVEQITIKAPLVLKLIAPKLLHKSDLNAVRIVKRNEDIKGEFNSLSTLAKKYHFKMQGILVQEFCAGIELIIGIKKDPTFGHVIVVGAGGIFTELLHDTATRKCPITPSDAREMIAELKARSLIEGFRGMKGNVPLLVKTLLQLSHLPAKHPTIQELDINPFILNARDGKIADARIVLQS